MNFFRSYKKVVNAFRFHLAKLIYDYGSDNKEGTFEYQNIKNIVINKADSKLGDTQVISFYIDSVKRLFPHIKITVLCADSVRAIYRDIYKVNTLLISKRPKFHELKKLSDTILADGNCCLFISTEEMCRPRDIYFAHCLKPAIFAGFDRRLKCINVNLFKRNHGKHITAYFLDLLALGGIKSSECSYTKLHGSVDLDWVAQYYQGKKTIGIAPCGASKSRHLRPDTIKKICRFLEKHTDYYIVPFIPSNCVKTRASIIPALNASRTIFLPTMSVPQFSAATGALDALISVDTANIHIAAASKVPTFGIYNGFGEETPRWFPGPAANPLSEHFQSDGIEIKDLSFEDLSGRLSSFLEKINKV